MILLLMLFGVYFGAGWFIYRRQAKHVVYGTYLPFNTVTPYLGRDFREGYHLPMKKKVVSVGGKRGNKGIPISVLFINSMFTWPITGIKMVLVHLMMKPVMEEEQKRLQPELSEEMEEVEHFLQRDES